MTDPLLAALAVLVAISTWLQSRINDRQRELVDNLAMQLTLHHVLHATGPQEMATSMRDAAMLFRAMADRTRDQKWAAELRAMADQQDMAAHRLDQPVWL
jgi:hypothetical protein